MREGWEYKKLGEVCHITMGQSPDGKSINANEGVEFHQGKTCFGEHTLGVSNLFSNAPVKLAEAHSVLLCVRAPVGYPNITDRKICIGRGLCALYAKEDIDNKFLFYSLLGKQSHFEKNATGSTFKAISSKVVSNTEIPIPPKSTQLAIVSELDKINELIRLKNEQLKDLDKLAQNIFYEMFGDPVENEKGWEVKKLKEIATEKLSYGSGASAVPFNTSVRYIRITDINEYGELKDEKVSPNIFEEKYLLAEGDILFARSGATVGKTYLHKRNKIPCIYAGYLIRLRPNEKLVLPNYVYYYTKSNYYKSFICANQRVVAQPNINAKQYGDLELPLPPLPLQHLFAHRIEQIEHQKSEVQKSITDLETLLASRMQYWFE